MDTSHEPEEARLSGRLNWLRAGVLGANDGIVSVAALVVGVAAATPENDVAILTAGIAALAAGALSMGVGEFVSVSSQRDAEKAQLARERRWHDERPEWELEQLARLNMETGMSEQTAIVAAREQTAKDPLAIHALMHLGIDPDELVSPVHAGIASLISFLVGGIVPVLLIVLVAPAWQVPTTAAAVVVMLAATGTLSARLAHSPYPRAIARNVLGGSLALAITYGIGAAVGVAV
ncbi:VIT1/CCC1 transporter family protein [Demequina activiva]|uniref:Membrane protein n=1 Tax=Demequina activiva TaxID=1582364 RepID=A0A919Q3L0_9MICO|nr:VIT1/CCC1 transporter family protein [Demequina activiva]GIG55171.1 membrane protein [Demequina activiva]